MNVELRDPRPVPQQEAQRRCTPVITIELQLWPPPPRNAKPHWWGLHDLTFYETDASGRLVPRGDGSNMFKEAWHRRIPEAAISSPLASVRLDANRGWLLRLHLTHNAARRVLDAIGLRDPAGQDDDAQWRLMPWACSHRDDHARIDGACIACGTPARAARHSLHTDRRWK